MAETKGEQWNEARFIEAIENRCDEKELDVAKALLEWAKSQSFKIEGGHGERTGTLSLKVVRAKDHIPTFSLNTDSTSYLYIHFERLLSRAPFKDLAPRQEVLRQLREKAGIDIPLSEASSWPQIKFAELADEHIREAVLEVLNSVVTALR